MFSSLQGESGGLGERPNESDKNNCIDEKSNMQNYKNTIVGKADLILCEGIQFTSAEAVFLSPSRAEGAGTIMKLGLPVRLKDADSKSHQGC